MNPPPIAEIEIRALAARDSLAQLTQLLHRAYAPLAALGMNLTAATQDVDATRERTLSGQTFVAQAGRDLVGTVTVCTPTEVAPGSLADQIPLYKDSHCCRFHQFAVDPAWKGRGLARLLLRQAEDWATERGYLALAVDMAEGATELCAFYRHMGYRPVEHVQWAGKSYRSLLFRKDLHQSPLRAPLLTMARYHRWATERLLTALQGLTDDEYQELRISGFASIHATLTHLLAAEREVWWPRLSGTPAASESVVDPDRLALAQRLGNAAAAWVDLIDAWPQDRLHGQLRFAQRPGEPEMLSVAEALLHVFNHATHHRGQVCAAFAALGRPVPALEVVVMLHEEAGQS